MMKRRFCIAAACGLMAVCGVAAAQPEGTPPPPPQREAGPRAGEPGLGERGPMDPKGMRERLERRLSETQRLQEQLRTAIERLEKGQSPGEAVRALDLLARPRMGREAGRGEPGRPEFEPEGMRGRGGPERGRPEGPGPRGIREGKFDGRFAPPGAELSAEQREVVMDAVREHLPTLAARMDALREMDPEAADRLMERLAPRLREAARVREQDPELAQLRLEDLRTGIEVLDAIRGLRRAQGMGVGEAREGAMERAKGDLRARLVEQHEVRMRLQAREVDALTKRLEDLKAELDRKRGEGEKNVEEVLKRITEHRPDGTRE